MKALMYTALVVVMACGATAFAGLPGAWDTGGEGDPTYNIFETPEEITSMDILGPVVTGYVVLIEDPNLQWNDPANWSDICWFDTPTHLFFYSDPLPSDAIVGAQQGSNTVYIVEVGPPTVYNPGHERTYNFWSDTDETEIPAPGAVLLGALGLTFAGWLKRRAA